VTWNLEPTWGEIRASADVGIILNDFYSWDVTDLTADWLNGVHPNYGMEIIGDERIQQRERAFAPREAAENFPRLRVDYTVVDDDLPPIVTVDPLPDYSRRSFTVSWSGHDQGPAGIDYYDVQYRVDGGSWIDWQVGVELTSAEFMNGENGRFYEFRARGVDTAGNVELFGAPEAATLVDTIPPTTTVDPLPPVVSDSTFFVSWTGSDGDGSGIRYYDIRTRFNDGPWSLWLAETLSTGETFTAMQGDGIYEFEARAVDNAGHVEQFHGVAEAATVVDAEAPFIRPWIWLPLVMNSTTVGQ
jgi:hypothetical protein